MSRPLLRKCFELSGVLPLGAYLVLHIASYARVLLGTAQFRLTSFDSPSSRAAQLGLELFLIWLPLGFHAGYGAFLSIVPAGSHGENRTQTLWLRVSGLASLGFLVVHSAEYRLPLLKGERTAEDVRPMLEASLSSTMQGIPVVAALHLIGLALVCVHFAIGLERFLERFAIADKERTRAFSRVLVLVVFLAGAATLLDLATGSAWPRFQP